MESKISKALNLSNSPVAVILTNEKPDEGLQLKEGSWGCVASFLAAAANGYTSIFDRKTFGCRGGGTGLGFGDQYMDFEIEKLLSTGYLEYSRNEGQKKVFREGEAFYKTPELARKFIDSLPMRNIPEEYIIFKPFEKVTENEEPNQIVFLVNPDRLSALVVLANYERSENDAVIAPFGAGCQSVLFGMSEAEKELPKAIIGFFDISARRHINMDLLSFTVPYEMFLEMENNVEGSFLERESWGKLVKRNFQKDVQHFEDVEHLI